VKVAAGLTIAAGRTSRVADHPRLPAIYKMSPEHGFAAQIAAGTTLYVGTHFGSRSRRRKSSRAR